MPACQATGWASPPWAPSGLACPATAGDSPGSRSRAGSPCPRALCGGCCLADQRTHCHMWDS
eukprot:3771751-Pyramimonas_sp.AAC.1